MHGFSCLSSYDTADKETKQAENKLSDTTNLSPDRRCMIRRMWGFDVAEKEEMRGGQSSKSENYDDCTWM